MSPGNSFSLCHIPVHILVIFNWGSFSVSSRMTLDKLQYITLMREDVVKHLSCWTLKTRERPWWSHCRHGPLTRYAKSRVAHTAGMPGTFSPPPTSKETASQRSRHASRHVRHARDVMHVGIATPWWRGKRSQHSRRMRNLQFYVSGKRPIRWWHRRWLYDDNMWFRRPVVPPVTT